MGGKAIRIFLILHIILVENKCTREPSVSIITLKIIVGDLVRLYTDANVHCESKKDKQSLIQVAEHIAWGY